MKKKESKEKSGMQSAFLSAVYELGDGYRLAFGKIFLFFGRIFKKLFSLIASFFIFIFTFFKKFFVKYFKVFKSEAASFFAEIKRAKPALYAAFKENKSLGFKLLFADVKKSFKVHSGFNYAVIRTVLPVIAVILLVSFIAAFGNLTFALKVEVGGKSVGIVRDETAYKTAEREALRRFRTLDSDVNISVPTYKFTLTTANHLDDTQKVCNNIISAVSDSAVNACGIYVNGKFLCAVGSEDTFTRVRDEILDDFAKKNGYTGANYTVDFNDEITTSSGFFPDGDKIWTAEELKEYLQSEKVPTITHTVAAEEKAEDILKKYNITEDKLLQLNPELETDNIPVGSTLLIQRGERNMKIKSTVTYTKVETTPFDTVSQYDNSILIGTTMTIVDGVEGRDIVSYTDTYIDGVKVDSSREKVRFNANNPVNKLIKIGTKGIPVGNNSIPVSPRLTRDQGGTFIWPAPDNCFWLSQRYNPSRSHYGIDICSSDDNSCRGRRIVAVADGIVVMATYHYSWGYYIRVDHGSGVVTGYAHALEGSFRVNVGDYVKAGQQLSSIGTTGNSSGYHLHFEVWLDGTRVDPLPYVYSYYIGADVR